MGALTHNGEVLQSLPANANQINFDKTGTDLNSTQTEDAIKEVNTKTNTNAADIDQLKSGLTNIVRISKTYNNVSIPASGYTTLDSMSTFPLEYQGYTLLSIVILSANYTYTNPLSITRGGDGTSIFAFGTEQTITNITVGYVLCDNVTDIIPT